MGEYKFQSLRIYQLSLDYIDLVYQLTNELPAIEEYNISSQIVRAATSISLNIAEGSTGQSNKDQNRFLSLALRSYLETVACLDIIQRRKYITQNDLVIIRKSGKELFFKITRFRKSLSTEPVSSPRSSRGAAPGRE